MLRTPVQMPCPANKLGLTSISYLRGGELAQEFIRLDKLYPVADGFASPLPVCRRKLAFPVETSWPGGGRAWPAEYADSKVVTAKAADAAEDAGETLGARVEAVGSDGVAAAARMANLTGGGQDDEPPARRARVTPARLRQ